MIASHIRYDAIATAVSARVGEFQSTGAVVGEFKARELSALAFAFAKAGHYTPRLFEALEAICALPGYTLSDFKPQAIAQVAWSFATAGRRSPQLFDAMAKAAVPLASDFQPWALAHTAWGYAAAQSRAPRLLGALADVAAPLVRREPRACTPEELSCLIWAFATAEATPRASQELFGALMDAMTPVVHELGCASLSQLCQGLARAQCVPSTALRDALDRRALDLADELSPSQSADVALAVALRHPGGDRDRDRGGGGGGGGGGSGGSDGSDGGGPPASLLDAKSTVQAVALASAVANDACSTTTPALSWTPISWAQFRASKKSEKLTMAELGSLWRTYKQENGIA